MSATAGPLARALRTRTTELRVRDLAPVTVAVLDTGIDGSHPELAGRMLRAVSCTTKDGIDIDVTPLAAEDNNDIYGHGTAVASIIARIAPNALFVDVRVLGRDALGSGEALLAGLEHAVDCEAHILNMSLAAKAVFVPRLAPLCDRAYRLGKPIVAARRNMPLIDEGFPAALIPCVGVDNMGAGPQDRWGYRTEIIEFAANGEDIPAAAAGGGKTTVTGSSFATPIVAAHVCLLLGAFPGLRPFEIKALLKEMSAPAEEPAANPPA